MKAIQRDSTRRRVAGVSAFLFACASITLGQSVPQTAGVSAGMRAKRAQQVRQLNNDVLGLHARLQEADPDGAEVLRAQAAVTLRTRASEMTALIQEDPGQALSLAFSPELLPDLAAKFPEAASQLETQGTWKGRIERWIMDYPNGSSRSQILLHGADTTLELHLAEPVGLKSGDQVSITGIRVGRNIAALDTTTELAGTLGMSTTSSTAIIPAMTTTTTASSSTAGVQNVAVFLITFPGVAPPSYLTPQSVYASYFGTAGRSLDAYWREASYGKTSATGSVFGWYTLSTSYGCTTTNNFDAMRNETLTQAANAGVNLQTYTSFAFVAPDYQCGWAGLASIGSMTLNSVTGGWSYINGTVWQNSNDDPVKTLAHEGGHNLGLNHSNSRAFGTDAVGPLGTTGTITEYGDQYSAMTNGAFGHYAAPHKVELLNWISPANYQVVQNSGTWTLQPFETSPTGLQALKIQRGTGNNVWLWVEYRQPVGNYDITYVNNYPQWYPWANQVFSGALIHYEDSQTGIYSHLLDFTPTSSSGFLDPDLAAGQSWTDPYTNLSITVLSATASGLTVSVSYGGATPCTHSNPTVSMSPPNPSVSAGSNVNYTVSVTNNDSSGCSASAFTMNSTQPSGWNGTFSATPLTVSPGQTASVTLGEAVPSTASPATYALTSSAANGSYTGSGAANSTVMVASTLTDTTSVAGSRYSARQTVPVTATVANGGVAAAGASVTFTLTKANGSKVTGTTVTDSTGKAAWSYKVTSKDPSGTYSVMNNTIYNSRPISSNTALFSVQ